MLYLKKLCPEKNITEEYLSWLNDDEVTIYTNQHNKNHTIENIKKFVIEKNNSPDEYLLGIFTVNDIHIGNIKIGPIDENGNSHLSFLIGNKSYWGRGYASLAIKKALIFAKKRKINRLVAYVAMSNIPSIKALLKNGFKNKRIQKNKINNDPKVKSIIILYRHIYN